VCARGDQPPPLDAPLISAAPPAVLA